MLRDGFENTIALTALTATTADAGQNITLCFLPHQTGPGPVRCSAVIYGPPHYRATCLRKFAYLTREAGTPPQRHRAAEGRQAGPIVSNICIAFCFVLCPGAANRSETYFGSKPATKPNAFHRHVVVLSFQLPVRHLLAGQNFTCGCIQLVQAAGVVVAARERNVRLVFAVEREARGVILKERRVGSRSKMSIAVIGCCAARAVPSLPTVANNLLFNIQLSGLNFPKE